MQTSSNVYVGLPFFAPTYYKDCSLSYIFFLFRLPCAAVLSCTMATSILECDNHALVVTYMVVLANHLRMESKFVRIRPDALFIIPPSLVQQHVLVLGAYMLSYSKVKHNHIVLFLLYQHVFDCAALFTIVRVCGRVDKTISLEKFTNTYFFCSASLKQISEQAEELQPCGNCSNQFNWPPVKFLWRIGSQKVIFLISCLCIMLPCMNRSQSGNHLDLKLT